MGIWRTRQSRQRRTSSRIVLFWHFIDSSIGREALGSTEGAEKVDKGGLKLDLFRTEVSDGHTILSRSKIRSWESTHAAMGGVSNKEGIEEYP